MGDSSNLKMFLQACECPVSPLFLEESLLTPGIARNAPKLNHNSQEVLLLGSHLFGTVQTQ